MGLVEISSENLTDDEKSLLQETNRISNLIVQGDMSPERAAELIYEFQENQKKMSSSQLT